ncbi:MAG: hypothetical protein IQL11_01385 [Bacteroidales bacterium]|nr:hypothetical protein [Bacteroidales bacterium]
MVKILIIPLCLILNFSHVTMTSIEHIPGTDSLKVVCRMDFGHFLFDYQTFDDDRNLTETFSKQPFPSDLVNKYFNSKVYIFVNNKLLIGKLLSTNLADNEIIMTLHYKTDKKPKKITIRNIMLTGWFSDQENLIIVRAKKFEKGVKLTPVKIEETFIIK